jgi:hypothetical protein
MNQDEDSQIEDDGERNEQQIPSPIERQDNAIDNQDRQTQGQETKRPEFNVRKRKNWPQRVEASCAVLLVLITAAYAWYARKQAIAATNAANAATNAAAAANSTLKEIQKTGTDTHDLAVQAGKQADAAKSQSANTELIAKAAQTQVATSISAADAAKSSADTAVRELELSERPWVDADVRINGPFAFDVNGANLSVLITIRNTGHSPAFNTTINPRLMILFGGPDPFQLRNEVCRDAIREVSTSGFGISLFPNANFQSPTKVGFGKEEIEKAGQGFGANLRGAIVGPRLIVCIAYRPTFNNTSVYTTGYIFDVSRIDTITNLQRIDFPIGEEVDANHLRLQFGLGAIVAN